MPEQTTNYNLVKQAVNEYYDREIDNQNLEIIDHAIKDAKDAADNIDLSQIEQSISDVDTKVSAHLVEDAVGVHKAHQISVVAPSGIMATTTQQYLDALFLGYSSKLEDMVDALLLINPSLPLNSNSTMQDVLNAIQSGGISSEVIKSTQRGTVLMNSTEKNITINPITLENSIVRISFNMIDSVSQNGNRILVSAEITNTTNLKLFVNTLLSTNQTVEYEIIEFKKLKSKQTGITAITTANIEKVVTVNPINPNKAMLFCSYHSESTGTPMLRMKHRIIDGTSIGFKLVTNYEIIKWQLIEFE